MQSRRQEIKDRLGNVVKGKWEQNKSNVTVNGRTLFFSYMANYMDAEFIAHAPTDIKFLLDALEQSKDRERVLLDVLEFVVETFERDIEQGYKTKDKEFVVDVLSKVLKEDKP